MKGITEKVEYNERTPLVVHIPKTVAVHDNVEQLSTHNRWKMFYKIKLSGGQLSHKLRYQELLLDDVSHQAIRYELHTAQWYSGQR